MEIKAKGKFDKESIRALSHVAVFKKSDPKKMFMTRIILWCVLFVVLVLEIIAFDADTLLFVLIGVGLFVVLCDCYYYFIWPKLNYNVLAKLKDAENEYTFCDDVLKISTEGNEYIGETQIKYSMLVKAYETSRHLFLFQTKNQSYIVDKSTIQGGTIAEVTDRLSVFLKDKYVRCKY